MTTTHHNTADLVPATSTAPAYYGGSESIGTEDLVLPKLYVAHSNSRAVQDGLVPFGALFVAYDADDAEPQTLFRPGQKTGLVIHMLGKRDVWCYRTEEDDRFTVVDLRQAVLPPAPSAQRGYDFAVLVPSYERRLPCSWLVKSSAVATGKRILTTIARAETPLLWSLAFALTTVQRQNDKGRWFVPQAVSVKAKPEHIDAAGKAAELLGVPAG